MTVLAKLLLLLLPTMNGFATSFSPEHLLAAPRLGPLISNEDGSLAVYTQRTYSFALQSFTGGLYLVDLLSNEPGQPKNIVDEVAATSAAWLDDNTILYVVDAGSNTSLHSYDVNSMTDGFIRDFPGEIFGLQTVKLEDNRVRLLFWTKVNQLGGISRQHDLDIPDALVYEQLGERLEDHWTTPNKNSIFTGTLTRNKNGKYEFSETPWNLLNSTVELRRLESPVPPRGDASDYSSCTSHVAFVAKDPTLNPATSRASHVYIISFDSPKYFHRINSVAGSSKAPVWSPDGKYLAYLEQRVEQHIADRTLSLLKV
jgi:pre-mRNA-splicing helicase BRR2